MQTTFTILGTTLCTCIIMYIAYIAFSFDWINDHIGLPIAETYVTLIRETK